MLAQRSQDAAVYAQSEVAVRSPVRGGPELWEAHLAEAEAAVHHSPIRNHFRRLFVARNVVIAVAALASVLLVATSTFKVPLPAVIAGIALLIVANLVTWQRLRLPQPLRDRELALHLIADIGVLSVVLYWTGGVDNPFASLYFLPVTIAALALPRREALGVAAVAAGGIALLLLFHRPLGPWPYGAEIAAHFLTLGLIVYIAMSLSAVTRTYDRLLSRARERELHDQHSVQLGAMAAGAAHELSTPLSTMAVLVQELRGSHPPTESEREEALRILADQIDFCRVSLSRLTDAAGHGRVGGGAGFGLDRFLDQVIEDYEVGHPGVLISRRMNGLQPAPQIIGDRKLSQAILALLDSAAVASAATTPRPVPVAMSASWDDALLTIRVCDAGPDIALDAGNFLGDPLFATKAPGRGMGISLQSAATAVRPFGGRLRLVRGEKSGACVELELPMSALAV
jgi:two-component system sensor histidine kinase RegB